MKGYISALPSARWNTARPRPLTILGSTGSIGVSALKVVEAQPHQFRVVALAGGRNIELLAAQISQFRPDWAAVQDEQAAQALLALLPDNFVGPSGQPVRIVHSAAGYAQVASLPDINTVLSAQSGAAGLYATMAAVVGGKVVCLANKESLVLAGNALRDACKASGASILPVDSEHNALFQLLRNRDDVARVCITASGGPFRGWKPEQLAKVTPEQALNHPKWRMGPKISIDSATLMNKGLEVIEACRLYGLPPDRVDVLVHPQSLVHALAEFTDGSFTAHLGMPDMRMPIAHCLNWPLTEPVGVARLDLASAATLTFEPADLYSFPCLKLAREALADETGTACILMNAANEIAVEAFLQEQIGFTDIPRCIAHVLAAMPSAVSHDADAASCNVIANLPAGLENLPGAKKAFAALEHIEALDATARKSARNWVEAVLPR